MFKYEWIWEKKGCVTGFLNAKYAPLKIHENICVFSNGAACPSSNPDAVHITYNPQYTNGQPYTYTNGVGSVYHCKKRLKHAKFSDGRRYPKDILRFKRDNGLHPTQKPVDLIRYLVRTYSAKGDTILDNCMGSGTTAIACIRENRNFIGFELDKKYYDIATKRIQQERQQLTLDLECPPLYE